MNRLDDALAAYHNALDLAPNDAELFLRRADILERAGSATEAVNLYENARNLNLDDPRAWSQEVRILASICAYSQAIEICQLAKERQSYSLDLQLLHATTLFCAGRSDDARRVLNEVNASSDEMNNASGMPILYPVLVLLSAGGRLPFGDRYTHKF